MSFEFNFSIGKSPKPQYVEIDMNGNIFYQLWSSMFNSKKIKCANSRIEAVLDNPAVMLNFKLISDLGSLGRVHEYKKGVINVNDILYQFKKQPNFFQSWEQFIWDYYFWVNTGTAYLYDDSNGLLGDSNNLYWLDPRRLQFNKETKDLLNSLILAKDTYKGLESKFVSYVHSNGKEMKISLKHIKPFFSMSNGISGNWYEGESPLDSLYKIISISDSSLNSLGVNLDKSKEFMVSKKESKEALNDFVTMGNDEKKDVEEKLSSSKTFVVSKAPVNVQRIVSDLANLKLDDTFLTMYFIVGKMLGIPKDVSEAYLTGGATFENQDKSSIKFISTSLQPLGDKLTAYLMNSQEKEDWRISWEHLPMFQTAKVEKENSRKTQLENLQLAVDLGLDESEVKRILTDIMQ